MKIVVRTSLIILLIFGMRVNVFSCNPPSAPANTTISANLSICQGLSTKLSVKGIGKIGWYSEPTGGTYLGNDSNYITGELTKTTTFYVQDSTCEASANRTAITVTIKLHAIADFSVQDICEGDSATFINLSRGAQTYKWKFGDAQASTEKSPKHFYTSIGCFPNVTLVAIDSNGCSDSISKPITINSYPISDFTFTVNQTKVNFKAKQAGNTIYKWFFGNIDSTLIPNPIYNFPKLDTYLVCLNVTNAAGCFSKTCKDISITAGISSTFKQNSFKIYPIPNSGNFTIRKETKEILTIEIINQMGQIVYKAELNDYLNPMNLNLPSGIYLIRVTNGENSQNQRMVVSK